MDPQATDPRALRRAGAVVVAAGVLGAAAVLWLERQRPGFEAWLREDPERMGERIRLVLGVLAVAGGFPLLAMGGWLWRAGEGRVVRMLGLVCCVFGGVLAALLWQIGRTITP